MQQSPPISAAPPPDSRWHGVRGALRAIRAVAALAAIVGASLGGFAACSSEECVGGVLVDGICQGKCEPDLCKDQNTCVDNQCKLL